MDRRSFLARLFGGTVALAAAVAIDPEILIWQPGTKTIYIPPAPEIAAMPVVTQDMLDAIVGAARNLFPVPKIRLDLFIPGATDFEIPGYGKGIIRGDCVSFKRPYTDTERLSMRRFSGWRDSEKH